MIPTSERKMKVGYYSEIDPVFQRSVIHGLPPTSRYERVGIERYNIRTPFSVSTLGIMVHFYDTGKFS